MYLLGDLLKSLSAYLHKSNETFDAQHAHHEFVFRTLQELRQAVYDAGIQAHTPNIAKAMEAADRVLKR